MLRMGGYLMVAVLTGSQSETFTPPTEEIQDAFPGIISDDLSPHGTDGPVGSSFSNYQYPVIRE